MTEAGPLSAADVTVAQALAHAATIALLQDRAAADANRLSALLQGAFSSRITIEQAKGAIAERAGIGMDEAFTRLRTYARERNAKLTDVAEALVTRALPAGEVDILIGPAQPSSS